MKLIKAARVYAAELPPVNELEPILESNKFTELSHLQGAGSGFVTLPNGKYILDFGLGFAFKLRRDEKILPASVINAKLRDKVAEMEAAQDRAIPAKERAQLKDSIHFEMLQQAFSKEQTITCFYWKKDKLLIVPTTSSKLADTVTSQLIRSEGSIKTTTINVDGVKQSLTSKLLTYLQDGELNIGFNFDSHVKLKTEEGKVVAIKGADLLESKEGILEAFEQGAKVVEAGLSTDDVFFRLGHDFVLRGVSFLIDSSDIEFEDDIDHFTHEAGVQTTLMADVILKLMSLFEYKSEGQAEAVNG